MAAIAAILTAVSLGLGLSRDPYIGVACSQGNSTTCGRVGIAVWLARRQAMRVDATLSGVRVRLSPPKTAGNFWVGFVHLPLQAMGLRGTWYGTPGKRLTLALRIHYPSGWRTGTLHVPLSPGWG
jgi:hypothetical protein